MKEKTKVRKDNSKTLFSKKQNEHTETTNVHKGNDQQAKSSNQTHTYQLPENELEHKSQSSRYQYHVQTKNDQPITSDDDDVNEQFTNLNNRIKTVQKGRQTITINKYPERDNMNYRNKIETNNKTTVEEASTQKIQDGKKRKIRSIVIMGDSIIKDIQAHKIRQGLKGNERVYVKSFPGATINDMKSYGIPSKKFSNDLVILHIGTNNMRDNKEPEEIANDIMEIAIDLKTEHNDVMISGIVPRNDKWDGKVAEVNKFLVSLCLIYNFNFIENDNIKKATHLNYSGLHLNYDGTYILGSNFVRAIRL